MTLASKLALSVVFALAGSCGESASDASRVPAAAVAPASEPAPAAADAHSLAPVTIDKGDGCTVLVRDPGRGNPARIGDEVTLDYVARVKDADTPFASTSTWSAPCRIALGAPSGPRVVPGLTRGLEGLKPGAKATITVPPALAYGKAGLPDAGIPSDATLVFEVEISGVRR